MAEFQKFKPRRRTAKNRFQLKTGLILETLFTINQVKQTMFDPRLKFEARLKFIKIQAPLSVLLI